MLEFGCDPKWSPGVCRKKWHELHPEDATSETDTPRSRNGSRFGQRRKSSRSSMEGDGYGSDEVEIFQMGRERWVGDEEDRAREERWRNQGKEIYIRAPLPVHGQQHHA